jgi:ABC-type phosphate transport system substrate-binding protein
MLLSFLLHMKAHPNCLLFLRYATAVGGGARFVRMINKAGRLVEANTTSVQAAMAAHATQFAEGNVVADITDAQGLASWPFTYMNYVVVWRNWTTFDCTNSQELLGFLAWMLTNDEYGDTCATHAHAQSRSRNLTPNTGHRRWWKASTLCHST